MPLPPRGVIALSAALAVAAAACASAPPNRLLAASVAEPTGRELTPAEQVTHVLSRLTFGARSGDAERVRELGVDRWIDAQLRPTAIPDGSSMAALARVPGWNPLAMLPPLMPPIASLMPVPRAMTPMVGRDTTRQLVRLQTPGQNVALSINSLPMWKVVRAQTTDRQLYEVVADFWENHFSVYSGKFPALGTLQAYDREVIYDHAFAKFRTLLGAVAHSGEMLYYLDNSVSKKGALNENYARELMELHTLGVDGGYTQHDVAEVARAFTGWSFLRSGTNATFVFRPESHDSGAKTVLGHHLRAGRGIEDGEEVLSILAAHPATARYIATKLARHFINDTPPVAVIDRAADAFRRTDGDIAQVVRSIVTSPEFFSRATFRAKVKTPFEFVVSARRAVGAWADTTPATIQMLRTMGQPVMGRLTPDGWPDVGEPWMTQGALMQRFTFSADLAGGRVSLAPIERWPAWATLSKLPAAQQADSVIRILLGGVAAPVTRDVMVAAHSDALGADGPDAGGLRLREMVAIALASPEFQHR